MDKLSWTLVFLGITGLFLSGWITWTHRKEKDLEWGLGVAGLVVTAAMIAVGAVQGVRATRDAEAASKRVEGLESAFTESQKPGGAFLDIYDARLGRPLETGKPIDCTIYKWNRGDLTADVFSEWSQASISPESIIESLSADNYPMPSATRHIAPDGRSHGQIHLSLPVTPDDLKEFEGGTKTILVISLFRYTDSENNTRQTFQVRAWDRKRNLLTVRKEETKNIETPATLAKAPAADRGRVNGWISVDETAVAFSEDMKSATLRCVVRAGKKPVTIIHLAAASMTGARFEEFFPRILNQLLQSKNVEIVIPPEGIREVDIEISTEAIAKLPAEIAAIRKLGFPTELRGFFVARITYQVANGAVEVQERFYSFSSETGRLALISSAVVE